jgi:hypothetical protein
LRPILIALAALALTSCRSMSSNGGPGGAYALASSCSTEAGAEEVSGTIRAFFAALARDDDSAIARLTTPGFYAFDIGKRFTGAELSASVADAHKAGRTIEWNIGTVTTVMDCDLASASWENVGASGTAPNLQPRAWLESATLLRRDGRWLIHFLHSTPKNPAR